MEEQFSPSGVKTSDMMFLVGCWNVFVWLDSIDNGSHKILIFDCCPNMLLERSLPPWQMTQKESNQGQGNLVTVHLM